MRPDISENDAVTNCHRHLLARVEQLAEGSNLRDFYLWPRTPIGHDHQSIISRRVGSSDFEVQDPRSRPAKIIRCIRELLKYDLIRKRFSMLDVACGDAVVLLQIRKAFPAAHAYGLDCLKGRFGTHETAMKEGVELYKGYIQHLFGQRVEHRFDLVLMLNTYRGWESAGLREHERNLPEQANRWFEEGSRYAIVTATARQINELKQRGLGIRRLGKGEDKSTMICVTSNSLPPTPWVGPFWLLGSCWRPKLSRRLDE